VLLHINYVPYFLVYKSYYKALINTDCSVYPEMTEYKNMELGMQTNPIIDDLIDAIGILLQFTGPLSLVVESSGGTKVKFQISKM